MSTLANVNDNPAAQADDGHDAKGRFKAGNKGGPGNPFAGQFASLRQMMLECVTKEDIQAIVRSLIELAKEGHWQAAKLVLAYTLGKPQSLADLGTALECEPGPTETPSPSPNAEIQETPPSPNGENETAPPSPNGTSPTLNRQERRAFRKAYRLAQQQRNTPKPVAAGPVPAI